MRSDSSPLTSCLYHGVVRHRRRRPFAHEFRYPLFLVCLDLDELDRVFSGRWLWSTSRPAVARFRRADYLGPPDEPLAECVRDRVAEQLRFRPTGAIRLVTNLRYWGYLINPVSFYFCYDAAGGQVEAVVAEVTNTPWGDRHCYVLPGPAAPTERVWRAQNRKELHVSPFFPMEMEYRWRISAPGERLSIHIENFVEDERQFDATLLLRRRPLTTSTLAASLLRHPCMTGRVAAGIYWQALKLWWKGAAVHPHPATGRAARQLVESV